MAYTDTDLLLAIEENVKIAFFIYECFVRRQIPVKAELMSFSRRNYCANHSLHLNFGTV